MSRSVTVLDYGMGNLRSVQRALEAAGAQVLVTSEASEAARADRLVVPGQGAFLEATRRLRERGLDDVLKAHFEAERPYLGICLGLQVLFDESEEHGPVEGLSILPGKVVHLGQRADDAGERLKVPHMGWSAVSKAKAHPVFSAIEEGDGSAADDPTRWFYFVHSYHCVPHDPEDMALVADYGGPVCAAVGHGNLVATQFHPEKSARAGHLMLKAFLEL